MCFNDCSYVQESALRFPQGPSARMQDYISPDNRSGQPATGGALAEASYSR